MSKVHDRLWLVGNIALVAALAAPILWISSAYAAQLNAVGVVSPVGAFQPQPTAGKRLGNVVHSVSNGNFANQFRTVEFDAPLVVNSQTFLTRWVNTVKSNKTNLLWSSYPASIRGQVFGNSPAGGDPFMGGGW